MREISPGSKNIMSQAGKKKPMTRGPWVRNSFGCLAGVGLAQGGNFGLFTTLNNLTRYHVHRKHGNRIMRTANNQAKVTTLATGFNHYSFICRLIHHNGVRFWTIHDAQSATFFRNTFVVINPGHVIHLKTLLIKKG
jgi:hypothetical protein